MNRPSLRLATLLLATCALVAPTLGRADQPAPVTVHPDSAPAASAAAPASTAPAPDDAEAVRRKADREAFVAARLAFLHAGLALTADQESLWPPVESALRSYAATHGHRHHHEDGSASSDGVGSSSNAMLKRRAERLIRRGEAIKSLAEAAGPLVKSLNDDQKSRLPRLLHGAHGVLAQAFDLRQDGSDHDRWREGQRDGGGDGWRGHREHADRDHGDHDRADRDDHRGYAERDGGDRNQAGRDDDDQAPPMHRHHHPDDERAEPMALRS